MIDGKDRQIDLIAEADKEQQKVYGWSGKDALARTIKAGEQLATDMDQSGDLYFVIIEWGGKQPPTTYYNWLGKLVGRVRKGVKASDDGSVAGRDKGKGIIFQESAIFVPSKSLAYGIGAMMRDWYPEVEVLVGKGSLVADFVTTDAGRQTIRRTAEVLSKRGRPPAATPWVVTCLECLDSYEIERSLPYQCPSCSGLDIGTRQGRRLVYMDDGRDVFELWKATRFMDGGRFELAKVSIVAGIALPLPAGEPAGIRDGDKGTALMLLEASTDLLDIVRRMPRQAALSALDGIFVARQYRAPADRLPARVGAVTHFFQMGGSPADVSLAEQPEPDLLDLALALGAEPAGTLAYQYYGAK